MCGLVGMITGLKNGFTGVDLDAFEHSMVLNGFRGIDSTGAFAVSNKGDLTYHKEIGDPWKFVETDEYKSLRGSAIRNGKILIGHGRKATTGKVTVENAHPFLVTTGDKKNPTADIALVHNGTLERYGNNSSINKFDVDSLWMTHEIAEKGPEEGIATIRGAIATMWYDLLTQKLYIYRNVQRPLWWCRLVNGNILINSENSVPAYLKYRFTWEVNHVEAFKPDHLYTIDLDTMKLGEKEVPWTIKEIKPKYTPYGSRGWDEQELNQWFRSHNAANAGRHGRGRNSGVTYFPPTTTGARPTLPEQPYTSRIGSSPDRLRNLLRSIVQGSLTMIKYEPEKNVELCFWARQSEPAVYQASPCIPNLVQIVAGKEENMIEWMFKKGDKIEYRYTRLLQPLPADPFAEILGTTTTPAILIPNFTAPVIPLSKREIKDDSKKYVIGGITASPGRINRWSHKVENGEVKHACLSDSNNPFLFRAYGNDKIGWYHEKMEVLVEIIESPAPKTTTDHTYRYRCRIINGDESPYLNDIDVCFYSASSRYNEGERLIGQIVNIRPAYISEFNSSNKRIYMILANMRELAFYDDAEISVIQNSPTLYHNIDDVVRDYNRILKERIH